MDALDVIFVLALAGVCLLPFLGKEEFRGG